MPKALLESEIGRLWKKHEDEDELIGELGRRCNVSPQAMGIRLTSLGIVKV